MNNDILSYPRGSEEPGLNGAALTREEVQAYGLRNPFPEKNGCRRPEAQMFCAREKWAALREELHSGPRLRRKLLARLLADAEAVVARPVMAYEAPESKVGPKINLLEAAQELWQRPVGDNLVLLAAAALLSDAPAFREKLREFVLAACDYETWGRGEIDGRLHLNNDLAAGHLARGIAVVWNWHRALFSEAEREKITRVMREKGAALLRGLYGEAFWCAAFRENHNHVSVAGLGLAGAAFIDDIPEAAEWLAAAVLNFERVLALSNADGSSAEGVPYWTYGLSFVLQFIEGTRHLVDTGGLYRSSHLREAAGHRVHMSTSGLGGTMPWGDSASRDFYGPHHLLYRLASRYGDGGAQYLADNLPFPPRNDSLLCLDRYFSLPGDGAGDIAVWTLLWHNPEVRAQPPGQLDYHGPVWDVVASRSGWGRGDYVLAVKSGFTNRNHSHLDAGALAFCFGEEWLVGAPGYGQGSGEKAFWDPSGPRWDYFSNATESHSTLVINGSNQRFDAGARGTIVHFSSDERACRMELDLSAAYDGVLSVRRQIVHWRGREIVVRDEIVAETPVEAEWLLQAAAPAECRDGQLVIRGKTGSLSVVLEGDASASGGPGLQERKPRSKRVDLPAGRLRTFAAKRTGKRVLFSAVLTPVAHLPAKSEPERLPMSEACGVF